MQQSTLGEGAIAPEHCPVLPNTQSLVGDCAIEPKHPIGPNNMSPIGECGITNPNPRRTEIKIPTITFG